MKNTKELAYLRQLCCSGLGQDLIVQELLTAVQRLIPSTNNVYSAVNDLGFPTAVITEFFDPKAVALFSELARPYFVKNFELLMLCDQIMASGKVINDPRMYSPDIYQSDLYHLVWRPLDQHHCLYGAVNAHGRKLGRFLLYRSLSEKTFNQHEEELFAQLLPYVAYAVQNTARLEAIYDGCGEQAMLIADGAGNVLHQSPVAYRLLWLASNQSPYLLKHAADFDQAQVIRWICGNLNAIFQYKDAPPPSFTHTNGCGRFIFKAYWLDKDNREPGGLIGITIEHHEPRTLKLLRALKDLPLSPVQKEVALLMAQGFSSENIGIHLHIKYNTVKDHVRKIFNKLGINSREELLQKLLAAAKQPEIVTQLRLFH